MDETCPLCILLIGLGVAAAVGGKVRALLASVPWSRLLCFCNGVCSLLLKIAVLLSALRRTKNTGSYPSMGTKFLPMEGPNTLIIVFQ